MVDGHELGLEAMAGWVGVNGRPGRIRHRDKSPIQVEMDVPLARDQMGGCPGDDARSRQAEPDPDGGRIPLSTCWGWGERIVTLAFVEGRTGAILVPSMEGTTNASASEDTAITASARLAI